MGAEASTDACETAEERARMGAEACTDSGETPEERAVERLDCDSLACILACLDARSLGVALGVSQHWRAAASSADLWAAACRARWQLPPPREGKGPGRPPHEMVGCASTGQARRCSSWPEAYRTFHRLRRPPLLHDRVAYANGVRHGVGCWLVVAHQPACKLPLALQASLLKVLRARVLVQNLRDEPIRISDGCLQVTYRAIDYDDGRSTLDAAGVPLAVRVVSAEVVTSREQGARPWASDEDDALPVISPSAAASAPESPGAAAVGAAEAAGAAGAVGAVGAAAVGASLASPLHAPLQLAPLEVALLDCEVPALTGMAHEPDVIEACHTLQLHVHTVASAGGSDRGKGVYRADPSPRGDLVVVGCPFAQERLFEHYQMINSGFWVHDAELDKITY